MMSLFVGQSATWGVAIQNGERANARTSERRHFSKETWWFAAGRTGARPSWGTEELTKVRAGARAHAIGVRVDCWTANGRTSERANGGAEKLANARTDERMHVRTDEHKNDERKSGRTSEHPNDHTGERAGARADERATLCERRRLTSF